MHSYGAFLPAIGGAQERNTGPCQHFSLRKSCPSSSYPQPDNSVPPHMSLVSLELLPQHWSSAGVSPSKSTHGPFKRNCLGLPQPQSPSVFTARIYGDFLVWGWDPSLLREDLRSQDIPPDFYLPMGVGPVHFVALPLPLVLM